MHSTTPFIIALASLAVAAPAAEEKRGDDQWNSVIDPWGLYGKKQDDYINHLRKRSGINIELVANDDTNTTDIHFGDTTYSARELQDLAQRAVDQTVNTKAYVGKIPGCDVDPSNKDTPKPAWPVNHGVKIPKTGDDDACTTGKGADHCWTEYRLVEAALEYVQWMPVGVGLNCPSDPGSTCSQGISGTQSTCTTTGTSKLNGVDKKVIDASGKIGIEFPNLSSLPFVSGGPKTALELSMGGSRSIQESTTVLDHKQDCISSQSTATCGWVTQKPEKEGATPNFCHQVWYADRNIHVWGQAQRVCNKCTKGNVQQNTGDGKVCVRGQKEFDFAIPINKLVHCDGKCGELNPGLNLPPNGQRYPYVLPNNIDQMIFG